MARLNLGCGPFRAGSWVNVDIGAHWNVDAVADLRALPFADLSCSQAYMGHVLEHLEMDDARQAVREAWRVLEPGGRLGVVGPCIRRAIARGCDEALLRDIEFGGIEDGTDWMRHKWRPTTGATWRLLAPFFPDVTEVDIEGPGLRYGWPVVSYAGWQCAFVATKEM